MPKGSGWMASEDTQWTKRPCRQPWASSHSDDARHKMRRKTARPPQMNAITWKPITNN
jgi:hypothetical protein